MKKELERRLIFTQFADQHFISALHGSGVGLLYKSVDQAYESAMTKIPTKRMTEILEAAVEEHQPPLVNGRRIKLRYAHLGGSNPPIIVIHGNQVDSYRAPIPAIWRTCSARYSNCPVHRCVSSTRAATTPMRTTRTSCLNVR